MKIAMSLWVRRGKCVIVMLSLHTQGARPRERRYVLGCKIGTLFCRGNGGVRGLIKLISSSYSMKFCIATCMYVCVCEAAAFIELDMPCNRKTAYAKFCHRNNYVLA